MAAEVFVPIGSSHINEVSYDAQTQYLDITFDDLQQYRYLSVPQSIFEGLRHSESPGKFFYRHIRDRYSSQLI